MNTNAAKKNLTDDPENWVDKYGNDLFRYALARLSDPEIAEDIVQETLVAAVQAFPNFQGRSAIKTWLIAILKRKIVNHFRRIKSHQRLTPIQDLPPHTDQMFDNSGHWGSVPTDWSNHPGKFYEQQEFMDVLYRCISKLPDRLAEIFMLREFEELSTAQICRQLSITESNSWVLLYRARLHLRSCLESNWLGKSK